MSRMKEIRKAKGYTLQDVSAATGYTKSFISQLERSLKHPSLEALRKLSNFYEIPFSMLVDSQTSPGGDPCTIIPPDKRHTLHFSSQSGTVYEILTPDTGGRGLCGIYVKIEPGESASGQQISHNYSEGVFVMEGEMTALIEDRTYTVSAGSSLYVEPNILHNYENRTKKPVVIIGYYYS